MESITAEQPPSTLRVCAAPGCGKPIIGRRKTAIYCSVKCNNTVSHKKWREQNVEEVRRRARQWREENLDRAHQNQMRWREENPDRWAEINRAAYERNKDKYNAKRRGDPRAKERMRAWQLANPDKISEYNRRRKAARRGAEGRHTNEDIAEIWARYGNACAYCGAPAEHTDHVHPLSRGGSDWPENLVPACTSCNLSKKNKPADQWYAELIYRQVAV